MSFVVELPTQFKQNAQLPNILGNTILTGNETIRGGLQVNGSLTIGEGTTSTSQSTFKSMDISTNLIVRQQSTLNTLAIESSLNVIGHSNFSDVSLNSLDVSNDLQVNGTSQFTGHIQAINISGENVDISENLIISNHLQGTDISCTNLEGTKGIIQDISLSNHMTIDQNLYISSQNLYLEDLNQTLSGKLSSFSSQISTVSTGQVTVNFSFMAKSNSPNVDACLNTILPFNALDLSGCFIEPPDETGNYNTSTYEYKMSASSSGIWNFGVKLLAVNTSSPENLAIGLFKNDDLIIQSHITHNSFHLSCLVDCSTNDKIYVKCTQGTGFINMDVSNSCFFGNRTTFSSTSINDNTNLRLNSLELSGGNFQLDTGNVILNSGDVSLNSGNVILNSGDISLNSGNVILNSGDISMNSGHIMMNNGDISMNNGHIMMNNGDISMNNGYIIANQITTSQLSGSNMDLCGNLSIQSSDYSISNERLMFDTIVIRRPSETTGDSNGTYYINLRELQMWVNNSNILPTSAGSGNNTENTPYDDISNQTTFIDWSTKESDGNYNNLTTYQVSNIYDEDINSTSLNIGNILSKDNYLTSVYIPLTTQYNINNIQSFVLYNRNIGVSTDFDRTQGLAIELYNRSIDSTLSTPIISTPEIDVTANIYRFDFPSLYTYPDASFVSSDSITNIIDSANSAVYNVSSKKIVNSTNVMSSIKSTHENDLSFDTIVIRRPTGYSIGDNDEVHGRELQCWVNNSNILFDNSQNLSGHFILWPDAETDIGYNTGYRDVPELYNNNISSVQQDVAIILGTYGSNTDTGMIIKNIPLTNINDIQSFVFHNRLAGENRVQGLAIELYNRTNDPSLNQILASTKIISQTANVYRFDFPSISTYTKGFAKGDSTYQIACSSYALTEVVSPNDVITLTLDNCKMGITTFHDYINVEGNVHTNGQVVITSQYTVDNKYFMKYNIDDSNYWNIYTNSYDHIYYNYGGTDKGFISSSGSGQMNFTGQHRCFIKDLPTISNEHIGLIVCANQNVYISMNEVKYGNEAITQNESLPYVSLCRKNNDKSCFGVISASEDPNIRKDEYGSFVSVFQKEKGDTRIYINSVGEGALWVINKNGTLESGDYITTCDISGYGMKQTSDDLKNYSVAKITMDCDFNPSLIPKQVILRNSSGENILNIHNQMQWTNDVDVSGNIVYEYQYKVKYINQDASEISQQEYIDQSNNAYIAAYVGCTYHCG